MKRITRISIENYKAYISNEEFELPNGQNLLLYGENGSGKSSLYRAIQHFMESSVNSVRQFDLNYYSGKPEGKIELTLCDYDPNTNQIDPTTSQVFCATESAATTTTTNNTLLMTGYRVSGFLDYSTLLKVYLNRGKRPNLFDLVNELLCDYIATNQGLTKSIGAIINEVNENIGDCYHRTDREYVRLKNLYSTLSAAYPHIIDDLNNKFSYLMSKYFSNLELNISLKGANMEINESGYIRETKIYGEIYLDVSHYGQPMLEYNTSLNEARLSAIAICLYLSSLKLRSIAHETKILYLDDVFVGLDSSNRRPVINMILSEFSDYQILISTYDKSWYMLAREIINDENKWVYKELYEGQITIGGIKLPKPVVISGKTEIEMARKHLFDNRRPDYPASANYMRKAYEGLLSDNLYRPTILSDELEPIAAYRLSALIKITIRFVRLIQNNAYACLLKVKMDELCSNLKPMLHPLSHYAPDEPVYKSELIKASCLYDEISELLRKADFQHTCKVIITKGGFMLLRVKGVSGWMLEYYLETESNMISYIDNLGHRVIANTPIHVYEIREYNAGQRLHVMPIGKNNRLRPQFTYTSIDDCLSKLFAYISSPTGENKADIDVLTPYTDMFLLPATRKRKNIKFKHKLTSKI